MRRPNGRAGLSSRRCCTTLTSLRSKGRIDGCCGRPKWAPKIIDDWPDRVPVFVEELKLYELYFAEELDEIFGIKK
jgi:hypothetical protein